jgi:galactose mutarotase-like enzyme
LQVLAFSRQRFTELKYIRYFIDFLTLRYVLYGVEFFLVFYGGFVRKKYLIWTALFALASVWLEARTFETNQYAVWGVNDGKFVIPAGGVITEAVLTVQDVWPQNASFYVHLLDDVSAGFETGLDTEAGNFFNSLGIPLWGVYENGNYVCRLSQNDPPSFIRNVFPAPTSITLANSSTALFSSSLLELMDYAGNGKGFGIGIDPGNTARLTIGGLKLELTIESYLSAGSTKLAFSYDLNVPAARWTLDDKTNSTAVADSGGAGLTGTASQNTAVTSVAGVMGGAMAFNGTSDFVQVAPHAAINQYGRGSFAVSAWIYPRSMGQDGAGRIVSKRNPGYEFYLTGQNAIAAYVPHTTRYAFQASANNAITLNTWQHVAFVYNEDGDNKIKLYVNGKLLTAASDIAGLGTLADDRLYALVIGRYGNFGIRHFDGFIDDVRIFNQSPSSARLEAMYNEVKTAGSLAARWTLDDKTNSTAVADSGGAGLTGTASQNTAVTSAAGVMGGAMAFNGTSDFVQVAPHAAINQYGRGSFAVSTWIYPRSMGQDGAGRIVSKRNSGYEFFLTGQNAVAVYIPHTTRYAFQTSANNTIMLNTWQHVAFVYNEDGDNKIKLYVNGKLLTAASDIAGLGTLSDDRQYALVIGRYGNFGIRHFDGFIDDVRIFNQTLGESQVDLLYNQTAADQR